MMDDVQFSREITALRAVTELQAERHPLALRKNQNS